jgi:predicted nuclease with TOPRIM domain
MTDEATTPAAKSPEEKKMNQNKRELRKIRVDMKVVREKAKDLAAERKKLRERYSELAAEAGLPGLAAKRKAPEAD